MREKSIRYRAPEQLRQRSRREALEPPSGTTLPIRYRRMAEETARSEPEGRGTPSGGRAATDDKTARKPRPEAGRNPRTTTAGAEPRQETRRKDDNQHPNRKAAGRHRAAGRQPTTKRPASPAPKRAGIRAQRRPERSPGRKPDGKTTTNIRTGRPRDAIGQPGGNRRQNGPQAPPEAGRNPRTTTAGAEPQGGDRRKNDGAVPEGDGSEQVRYEVLCQCFSHPDSEEATSIHTSFS